MIYNVDVALYHLHGLHLALNCSKFPSFRVKNGVVLFGNLLALLPSAAAPGCAETALALTLVQDWSVGPGDVVSEAQPAVDRGGLQQVLGPYALLGAVL